MSAPVEIAREALSDLGWRLEDRSGITCRVEDDGGVGVATTSEMIMYHALVRISAATPLNDGEGLS